MTMMCLDCKSTNIVEISIYQGYFREGDFIRLRSIIIRENLNGNSPGGFIASCPELHRIATASGETTIEAINNLAELLYQVMGAKLLGKKIEDD